MNLCLQFAESSETGWVIDLLSQSSLLSNDAVLDTTTSKVAAFMIKFFLVVPLITVCSAIDLGFWLLKTVCIIPVCLRGIKAHLVDLINIVVMPILVLGLALVNRLPDKRPLTNVQMQNHRPSDPNNPTSPTVLRAEPPPKVRTTRVRQKVADPNAISSPFTLLTAKVFDHDVEGVENLLQQGANPNLIDPAQFTPLTELVSCVSFNDMRLQGKKRNRTIYKMTQIAGLLISHGALVNALDKSGRTPLGLALAYQHKELASKFLLNGADPLLVQGDGSIPLLRYAFEPTVHIDTKLLMLARILNPSSNPDVEIETGPLKGCTKRALAIALYIGGAVTPIILEAKEVPDTILLCDLWKLFESNSWMSPPSPEGKIALMKQVVTYDEANERFSNPYVQAFSFVLRHCPQMSFAGSKKVLHEITTGVTAKTTAELFKTFADFAPEMSKDLCSIISNYAVWEPPQPTITP